MARASQILGAAFERRVEHRATLPIWVKVPTAHKRAGSTWLDYIGATSRGRFVTADAKWCPSGRVTKSVLSKAQQLHADKALAEPVRKVALQIANSRRWEDAEKLKKQSPESASPEEVAAKEKAKANND